MPPYSQITDLLANFYQPNILWRNQWDLIKEMAWIIEDSSAFSNNRVCLGNAIQEGIRRAYIKQSFPSPNLMRIRRIKENAIKDIEDFRQKPEYWANIR